MSNTYYPDPYQPTNLVLSDMDKINDNFEALRSVFSSSSGPAIPVAYQLWADSENKILKINNHLDSAWLPMFNVEDNEIIIQDSVRKGSIVDGEDINPATCTLNTCSGGGSSGMNLPSEVMGSGTYSISISAPSGGFVDIPSLEGLFYIYDAIPIRGRIRVDTDFSQTVKVRYEIGIETSTESVPFVAQGGAWSSEVLLTTAGLGWQTVKWQIDWGTVSSGTIYVRGHSLSEVIT